MRAWIAAQPLETAIVDVKGNTSVGATCPVIKWQMFEVHTKFHQGTTTKYQCVFAF
jgi:hypothetical protein